MSESFIIVVTLFVLSLCTFFEGRRGRQGWVERGRQGRVERERQGRVKRGRQGGVERGRRVHATFFIKITYVSVSSDTFLRVFRWQSPPVAAALLINLNVLLLYG